MLTPPRLAQLPESIIPLVDELQTDILDSICKKLMKANYLTPSAEWQLYKANQLRLSSNEVIALIGKSTGKRKSEIKNIYTEACKEAISNDAKIYREVGKDAGSFFRSVAFSNVLKAGIKKANGLMSNFTRSAAGAANKTLAHLMDKAYLQVTSGAFTAEEAIYSVVAELADKGVQTVTYPSGRTDWMDVAVRRAVITGVGQTTGQMQLDLATEMDCDLVEVTSHLGARPEHALWQGKIYSISGNHKKYPKLSIATGYGTGAGLKGWNCRHDFYPFFEGVSVPGARSISLQENQKEYENSQRQRSMERGIRQSKRRLSCFDTAIKNTGSDELKEKLQRQFDRTAVTLKNREARLKEFLQLNGMLPDNARIRVVGFNRSVSGKAVQGAERRYKLQMRQMGIENPPKTLAIFREAMYNNSPGFEPLRRYVKSVRSGMLSPMSGFEQYAALYERVEQEIVGIKTVNGIEIKGQSAHFLERLIGTVKDPETGRPRKGVAFEDALEALTKGTARPVVTTNGLKSQQFVTENCAVSVNPETGILIQCNP